MSAGNRCDCCCVCGLFCSGGECGRDYDFNGTTSGASNGTSGNCAGSGNAADCAFVHNVAFSYTFLGSGDAATWNASFKPNAAAFDAKSGTNVCRWQSNDVTTTTCAAPFQTNLTGGVLHIYYGTDDKWHAVISMPYDESSGLSTTLEGDAEFAGGGAPMDCEAFSLSITLAVDSGTPLECNPPTAILIENAP